jgi:hypothetical protein
MKSMIRYTEKPQTLMVEYKDLKAKLFGDQSFVLSEDTWEWQRFIQLLGLFHSCFRTDAWQNPLQGQTA